MSLATGQILNNRYRIVKLLGQGGFGAIYRAWDTNLKAPCAVKMNTETTSEAAKQFTREAQMLANLNHPHLPKVTDYFNIEGQGQYLVMEYIEGEDLQTMIENANAAGTFLPEADVMTWMGQVCDALVYMHNRTSPIIHRDLKPANIRITPEGRAVLVDFGIAKAYQPNMATAAAAKAVTPGFSPPEQYSGAGTDARSDIYAFGATLYNLLTGSVPPESVMRMAGQDNLASPRAHNPAVSPGAEAIIMKSMALQASDRYQRTDELKTDMSAPRARTPVDPTAKVSWPAGTERVAPGYPGDPGQAAVYPAVGATAVETGAAKSGLVKFLPWAVAALGGGAIIVLVVLGMMLFGGNDTKDNDSATAEWVLAMTQTAIAKIATQQAIPPATQAPLPTYTSFPTFTIPALPTLAPTLAPTHTIRPTDPPTATTVSATKPKVRIRNRTGRNVNLYRYGSAGERHFLGWLVPNYYGEYTFPSLGTWTIGYCYRDEYGNDSNCKTKDINVTSSGQEFSVP